jgi:putative SOS response-associated peptidase YedK
LGTLGARSANALFLYYHHDRSNALMQPIHERMPVIMPVDHYRDWLNKSATEDVAFQLLDNAAYVDMTTTPISDYVNNPRHDDERCLEPLYKTTII